MRLAGRVALVTGAGSGMGRASAIRFAEEGATVVATDLDEASVRETADQITAAGGAARWAVLDVTSRENIDRVVAEVERDHGILHVLFNHVGAPGAAGLDITDEEWQFAIDVNLKGGFFLTGAALPLLRKASGSASVIFTASTAGLVGSPISPLYSLTKGGVVNFVRGLALNLAADGIRVNGICPGPIDTPMLPKFFSRAAEGVPAELMQQYMSVIPLGRAGTVTEIANAALFLACDESSFITGVPLPVDGGYLAR
ncbi:MULTISPECIES: SDR family NAD(P)-dependent oxidoreductase [Polymorphospora]|uniref:SDR family NAD(P)-dependent oxidoreductase n=1 Tax=Polymorphospora lycopeni TaxID=3140240 RepID=A0ABV5CMM9_9ACTN